MWLQKIMGIALAFGVISVPFYVQGKMFVYPEKGQTPEQQEQDEFACYKWAKEQTGIDPNQPPQTSGPPPPKGGGAISGAMGGAALGAIGGAIAGDAGKGAAIGGAIGGTRGARLQRSAELEYQRAQEEAKAKQSENYQTFNRAYSTCLGARGYKVG